MSDKESPGLVGRIREMRGALFGTPGRAAATCGVAVVLLVFAYLVLLPSGVFDDRAFVPAPWEDWGLPGEPPRPRPLLGEWFASSAAWQEFERLWSGPGVEDAFRSLMGWDPTDPDGTHPEVEEINAAMPLLSALGEAGMVLTPVAREYALSLPGDPVGDRLGGTSELLRLCRGFRNLVRLSLRDQSTGRDAREWLGHFGGFATAQQSLGETGLINFAISMSIASVFIETAIEALAHPEMAWDEDSIGVVRRHLRTVADEGAGLFARANYSEAQWTGKLLGDHVGPGAAWRNPGEMLSSWDLHFEFLRDWPDWLEYPVNWWIVARIQRNQTLTRLEATQQGIAAWLEVPLWELSEFQEAEALCWRNFVDPRPNAIGDRMLAGSLETAWRFVFTRQTRSAAAATMVDTAFAILQWREAGGHAGLPGTLDALVPEFLDAIPVDPFSGRPFGYDPDRGFLWSVGEDGIDTGGVRPRRSFRLDSELGHGSGTLDLGRIFGLEPAAESPDGGD